MEKLASLFTPIERPKLLDDETRDPTAFAHWVRKTSELIGRPYMQTFKLVESWPVWKIEQRYKEATSCSELTKPAIRWWALRKREKAAITPSSLAP